MATRIDIEPDVGIPDLVRRLTDDSRRLLGDEVQLAKLEIETSIRTGSRGLIWLGIAFGAGTVALIAVTVLVIALLGRLFGNVWAGALVTGAVEALVGALLVRRGLSLLREPSYALDATRASLAATARWARNPRSRV